MGRDEERGNEEGIRRRRGSLTISPQILEGFEAEIASWWFEENEVAVGWLVSRV